MVKQELNLNTLGVFDNLPDESERSNKKLYAFVNDIPEDILCDKKSLDPCEILKKKQDFAIKDLESVAKVTDNYEIFYCKEKGCGLGSIISNPNYIVDQIVKNDIDRKSVV